MNKQEMQATPHGAAKAANEALHNDPNNVEPKAAQIVTPPPTSAKGDDSLMSQPEKSS